MMTSIALERELGLPQPELINLESVCLSYCAEEVFAEYCGLAHPLPVGNLAWQHGWVPRNRQIDPAAVMTQNLPEGGACLVARKDEEEYLKANGVSKARAAGLPIVYSHVPNIPRRTNTLLVMPAHTLDYTTHSWRVSEYVDAIDAVRPLFSEVVICIHPSCLRNGYWVSEFQAKNYPVIRGIESTDRFAFARLVRILKSFEFVTSNTIGSHLPYAAWLGAKVSIFGPYAQYGEGDYSNTPFYQENPHVLPLTLSSLKESAVRNAFPELFRRPRDASVSSNWGAHQIGLEQRLSPPELRSVLGWNRVGKAKRLLSTSRHRAVQIMSPWLPPKLKTVVKMSTDKRLRRITAEISRLRRLPPRVATITTLLGKEFEMVDAPSFLCTYESLFEKQIYRFASAKSCPVILDCGANTGVSVVYFKHLFPDCRVTAFEPDPRIFEALRRNVMERFQFEDVTLIPKAVWDKEAVIPFIADGAVSGRIEPNRTGIPSSEIGTVRLREFLLREEIDLLKLDIEGAETAVLEDCAQSLTGVRNLFVEYHSYASKPQTLHRIISVLSAANFRLHIHPELASPQPFFVRNIYSGMDHQLNIFAFR